MATHKRKHPEELPKAEPLIPDRAAPGARPKGGKPRPGFDLGGVAPGDRRGPHTTIPGGPRSGPRPGGTARKGPGRAGSGSGGGPTDGTS